MTDELLSRWSSRKFWTMVAAVILFTVLLAVKLISESAYIALILPTIGSYFVSNVSQHIWGKK